MHPRSDIARLLFALALAFGASGASGGPFAASKTLAVQIALDRRGFSCGAIDGSWGRRSQSALEAYCRARRLAIPDSAESAFDSLFAGDASALAAVTVSERDLAALRSIPSDPAAKASLDSLGYASIREMFAERGHLSVRALDRLNPGVDWDAVGAGTRLVVPRFAANAAYFARGNRPRPSLADPGEGSLVRISLSRYEMTVYNSRGEVLALFPCSIARDKAKLPKAGTLAIKTAIANPDYTYTPDRANALARVRRHIYAPGPNNPVGVAWLGLTLDGYGIHGTPEPERVGCAESHGCFRLANWNAARLFALCRVGTPVEIAP